MEKKHEHETERLTGDIREKSKKSYGAAVNTRMIDPVAMPSQAQGIDEDWEELPIISMSLPPGRR